MLEKYTELKKINLCTKRNLSCVREKKNEKTALVGVCHDVGDMS